VGAADASAHAGAADGGASGSTFACTFPYIQTYCGAVSYWHPHGARLLHDGLRLPGLRSDHPARSGAAAPVRRWDSISNHDSAGVGRDPVSASEGS
jgi:hypothetical protein